MKKNRINLLAIILVLLLTLSSFSGGIGIRIYETKMREYSRIFL